MAYHNAIFDLEAVQEEYKSTEYRLTVQEETILVCSKRTHEEAVDLQVRNIRNTLLDIPDMLHTIANRLDRMAERPDTVSALRNLAENMTAGNDYKLSQLTEITAQLSDRTPMRIKQLVMDLRINIKTAINGYQMLERLLHMDAEAIRLAIHG